MKITNSRILVTTAAISIMFFACTSSLEQDAKHLASLQKERTEIIKLMLHSEDSIQISSFHQKLQQITTAYRNFKDKIEVKYKNANKLAKFEEAYREALE